MEATGGARLDGDTAEGQELVLSDELEMWSQQLHSLCGDTVPSDEDDTEGTHTSAADIANECLELLTALHIDENEQICFISCQSSNWLASYTRDNTGKIADAPSREDAAVKNVPVLLQELDSVASELHDLMNVLMGSTSEEACSDTTSEAVTSLPSSPRAQPSRHHSMKLNIQDTAQSSPPPPVVPSLTMAMCTSPKMKHLTERLQKRQGNYQPPKHRTTHLQLRLRALAAKKHNAEEKPKSVTRRLLDDSTFWRQYQSKSFRQHISRQSKAREIQDEERQKQQKTVEYRYRKVPNPCYPLALKRAQSITPVRTLSRRMYATKSPAGSTLQGDYAADGGGQLGDQSLLCGVYLYGRRRKGMQYLTCSSLEEIKQRVVERFKLSAPVVNLYREQVSKLTPGAKSERKYLYRIVSFHNIRSGDLLCATTSGQEDMAILCAWMKARQHVVHPLSSSKTFVENKVEEREPSMERKQRSISGCEESLTYKASSPPEVKLWDGNGRLVNICKNLPI